MAATTVTSWARLLHGALGRNGLDADAMFRRAGLDPAKLEQPGARYSLERIQALWRMAVAETRDEDFGLEAAHCWHPTSWHALGYAWLASVTLRDAFERMMRYGRLVTDALVIEIVPTARGAWVQGRKRPGLPDLVRAAQDSALATVVSMCRLSRGPDFRPLAVRFAYPRPERIEALEAYFGAPLEFGNARGGLEIATADMEAQLPSANAELARTNDQVIRDYLARFDASSVAQRARVELLEELPSGNACETSVAHALGMSERTLQRRLREENTSYRQILDDVRRELAIRYLSSGSRSVNEITYLLGFAEPSSFTRAFRRWTGVCPSTFRDEGPASRRAG